MDRLTQFKKERKKTNKKKRNTAVPEYNIDGKLVAPEKTRRRRHRIATICILVILAALIYVPGFFMKDEEEQQFTASPDSTAIRLCNSALRDLPNDDFDGDGLINSEETQLGTDPWNIDTDGDGATDFYEVKASDTDPLKSDNVLSDLQTKTDEQKGKDLNSPYKIGNVILWPDDYHSRAYGSVIETLKGYRFCEFTGYAQFPNEETIYAYKVEDGQRTLLNYRKQENVWHVSAGDTVELYTQKLNEVVKVTLFNMFTTYLPSNTFTDILATALPDKGFVTAVKMTDVDVEPDTNEDTTVQIAKPAFDSSDYTRFEADTNTVNDLLFVREAISDYQSCIAVSLYNEDYGEYLGIVYGYTADGDLLVADMETLEPIGTLTIQEKAKKIVDDTGNIVSVSYFDFAGFGFNSLNGDRISFFSASSERVISENFGTQEETEGEEESAEDEGAPQEEDIGTDDGQTDAASDAAQDAQDTQNEVKSEVDSAIAEMEGTADSQDAEQRSGSEQDVASNAADNGDSGDAAG